MKSDLPAAALRLMASCRVTTHERKPFIRAGSPMNSRPLTVGGCVYESVAEAARQLNCSRGKLRLMIQRGEANYV